MSKTRMRRELANEILHKVEIRYNKDQVDEWYDSLKNDQKSELKKLVATFARVYPNNAISALNMYMQLADGTIEWRGHTLCKLPHYDEFYSNRTTNVLTNYGYEQDVDRIGPGQRMFKFFEGFLRTPLAEYEAFASVRDLGSNMDKILSILENLERK
jgi:hypothetical protein